MFEGYTILSIILLIVVVLIFAFIKGLKRYNLSFGTQVLIGLGLGIVFGLLMYVISTFSDSKQTEGLEVVADWLNLIGSAFTGLLKMIVVPLIFVMIITAIVNMPSGSKKVKKWMLIVVAALITSTVIGAVVGIIIAFVFGLDASLITMTSEIASSGAALEVKAVEGATTFIELLTSFIPANPFADLAGLRTTSMIGVVIFASFMGFGGYMLLVKEPKSGNVFKNVMNAFKEVIMIVVMVIIKLTPYGVFAIIARTVYSTNYKSIVELGKFAIASYVAIFIMFLILLIPLLILRLNPSMYLKKVWETLVFAFSSRSSVATVPKMYTTQSKLLGVEDGLASLSSSLGASMGQTGCAGIYPAMLAVMIAVGEGYDINIAFIIKLLIIIGVTAFAVAGVGGGATNASIIVLVAMGFPIALAAVLISIEPIIDMARTALNVNGSMMAGVVTAAATDSLDKELFNADTQINLN